MTLAQHEKLFIKYSLSGGLATGLELLLLYQLVDRWRWDYLPASALAFAFGLIISFFFRKLWVFADSSWSQALRQFGLYSFILLVNVVINIGLMFCLVGWLQVDYLMAQLTANLFLGIISYLFNSLVTFPITKKLAMNLPKQLKQLKARNGR